jgi:hypothetical protein
LQALQAEKTVNNTDMQFPSYWNEMSKRQPTLASSRAAAQNPFRSY